MPSVRRCALLRTWISLSLVACVTYHQPAVAFASDPPAGSPSPDPRDYLYERAPDLAPRLDCIITGESGWDPSVRNPRTSAAGLAQFLPSTWATTPQGQLGLSPYDPLPNINAAIWLAQTKGWTQWQVYTAGGCRT